MYVLGLSCYYHDSAAALLKNGRLIAAAAQERFSRVKHDPSFPLQAINYCLTSQKIKAQDLDCIGFYEQPFAKFDRVLSQHIQEFPRSRDSFISTLPAWTSQRLQLKRTLKTTLGYSGRLEYVPHHLAHAAAAYLVSPFPKAAILVADGVGEWATASLGFGHGSQIRLTHQLTFPHSIGLFYSAITAFLGFAVNDAEYQVMGLAAFGNPDRTTNPFYRLLRQVIDIKPDGSFRLDMDYFAYTRSDRMVTPRLANLLAVPDRTPNQPISAAHRHIAAAAQAILEDTVILSLKHLHSLHPHDALVMGGGVALNSVVNGKILSTTPFTHLWIPPDPGDAGASIGAASYLHHSFVNHPRRFTLSHPYLGPAYSASYIQTFLDSRHISYSTFTSRNHLLDTTARLLLTNRVVAWFQGSMEWGPRALGNRSILANPLNPRMKDTLNRKVKHREPFRPFAPAICKGQAARFFLVDQPLPQSANFMLHVYPVKTRYRQILPATTHIDGTARPQTVDRRHNPLFYDLIRRFGKLSGVPILLNTSFNISGEPIVCTPEDALYCFRATRIDYLVMDKYLISRQDNFAKL